MQLTFCWIDEHGALTPRCECDVVNVDGFCLLTTILMDDGGCGYERSLDWLNEGLKRINSVLSGKSESLDWDREAWGASITTQQVRIYSLFDESYFQDFRPEQFQMALVTWKSFLLSPASTGSTKVVEV